MCDLEFDIHVSTYPYIHRHPATHIKNAHKTQATQ